MSILLSTSISLEQPKLNHYKEQLYWKKPYSSFLPYYLKLCCKTKKSNIQEDVSYLFALVKVVIHNQLPIHVHYTFKENNLYN